MKTESHPVLLISLILGAVLTLGMMFFAFMYLLGLEKNKFEQYHNHVVEHIEMRMAQIRNELSGLTASLYAANGIESDTLRLNAEHLFAKYNFVSTVVFAPKISQQQRDSFENEMHDAGFIDYQIGNDDGKTWQPSPARAYYFPIRFVEPYDVSHVPLLGLDLLGQPLLAETLHDVITGDEVISLVMRLDEQIPRLWMFEALYAGYVGVSDPYFQQNRTDLVNAVLGMGLDIETLLAPASVPNDTSVSVVVYQPAEGRPFTFNFASVTEPAWWSGFMLEQTTPHILGQDIAVNTTHVVYWFDRNFLFFYLSGALGIGLTILLVFTLRQLVGSEERKHAILEMASDAVINIDHQGKVLDVNPAAEKLFTCRGYKLQGKYVYDLFAFPQWAHEEPSFAAFVHKHPMLLQGVQEVKAGLLAEKDKCTEVSISEVYGVGKQTLFTLFARDVTERKRLQKQSEHTQRLESLGVLAGGIAHDFNNLLTVIMGHAGMAMQKLKHEPKLQQHLQQVVKASENAAALCEQMLAYSGKGAFFVKRLDISQTVKGISQLLSATVNKSVKVEMRLMTDLPKVEGDVGQIQQVIMNLIINASEAISEHKGVVRVQTSKVDLNQMMIEALVEGEAMQAGVFVKLTVEDTGCGMDAVTLQKIFDPFFTTKFTGRGLGMSAVLGIMRGHHGGLHVVSKVGKGTTFEVFFPVAKEH
ncbi:ATP-binding protein [Ghiorsea bivora]|uniref:ATP-binding protein n=1 Tax=Ghiorsea bivora TaxID=1485545 RepID=UPI00069085D8|nr:ATP-binding protein [Ghiorsea bivora]